MLSNIQKLTAVTGAAVLALGAGGTAFANGSVAGDTSKPGTHAPQHVAPTFAQVQAGIIKRIDHRLAVIAKAEARVMASTVLTTAQKTAATARLAAKATALADLKAKIAAASAKADIEAALNAFFSSGGRLFRDDHRGDRDADKRADKAVHQDPTHKVLVHRATGKATPIPGRSWSATSWGTHPVTRVVSLGGHSPMQGSAQHDTGRDSQWLHGGGSHR